MTTTSRLSSNQLASHFPRSPACCITSVIGAIIKSSEVADDKKKKKQSTHFSDVVFNFLRQNKFVLLLCIISLPVRFLLRLNESESCLTSQLHKWKLQIIWFEMFLLRDAMKHLLER